MTVGLVYIVMVTAIISPFAVVFLYTRMTARVKATENKTSSADDVAKSWLEKKRLAEEKALDLQFFIMASDYEQLHEEWSLPQYLRRGVSSLPVLTEGRLKLIKLVRTLRTKISNVQEFIDEISDEEIRTILQTNLDRRRVMVNFIYSQLRLAVTKEEELDSYTDILNSITEQLEKMLTDSSKAIK